MKHTKQATGILSVTIVWIVCAVVFVPVAYGQDAPLGKASKTAPPLIQQMVGSWNVQQQMWTGPDAEAIHLPPAVAHRRLVQGEFLREVMKPAQKSGQTSFTRTAYLNYNPVSQRFEYFSLDTRAPQMMSYESAKRKRSNESNIQFSGGRFVAAQWGEAKNVAFKYQLKVGEVENDRQVVKLYFTPLSEQDPEEFLAFKYVYTIQN